MTQRKKSPTDRYVTNFRGAGVDVKDDLAVLDCVCADGETFSLVFPADCLQRLIALGITMSGALTREGRSESHALIPSAFQCGVAPDGHLLLRLVLQDDIPVTFMLERPDALRLTEKLGQVLTIGARTEMGTVWH
jgi:hypothetical protein